MEEINYNIDKIKEIIDKTINLILIKDKTLFEDAANERTISGKLSTYLASEFPNMEVDPEYNRDMHEVKRLEQKRINPDIVIHHRVSEDNLLVIEIKKSPPYSLSYEEVKKDIERLKKMTSDSKYHYKFGLFILFYVGEDFRKNPILKYYQNGKEL